MSKKRITGYSDKTKNYHLKAIQTVEKLKKDLIIDTKLGAYTQINDLRNIKGEIRKG